MGPDSTLTGDEIHWSRATPRHARAMLLAGAPAARARVGYHGARHRRHAEAFVDRVRLLPTSGDGRRLIAARTLSVNRFARRGPVSVRFLLRSAIVGASRQESGENRCRTSV